MKIGIIGTTPQAETMARLFSQKDNSVTISDPTSPERADRLAAEVSATTQSPYDQAALSDVLALAVPWSDLPTALTKLGPAPDAVVIDAMVPQGPVRDSGAEQLAHMMDNPHVVEVRVENLQAGATVSLCGDDPQAKEKIMDLLRASGLQPTDIGALARASELERGVELRPAV
jgi:predicted dinucleotide-binding enzyme